MYDYKFHHEQSVSVNQVKLLYNSVGWWPERKEEDISKMLENSIAIGVWKEDQLIGFARAVTDGVFRAYIEDVVVHDRVRNKGIGEKMMTMLLDELAHIDIVSLFCEEKLIKFYGKQQFKATKQIVMHRNQLTR
ncbi:GNAT family N-acetyltransferase [Bacillus pseudomycoides]|uniref:GNAT family N-acetyltransferase n=1 Tax=Bacillus pseudomycoides TaxID=64104 RepID=A0AA91VCL1_9BACI|nr:MULTISPECIES: GNAT family N-acetyltransferase [Bacillus]PEB51439.1 GNAT family N-acetyltransferase [Bacillus sp. AFS098217]PED82597.1 GNAT family N-acetyltransferase [Bacillus pseudomycoides]PEU12113.1 GNAT family N-acetyltransferase [Bacillus sp. AFS014408]PEU17703.1 GNAT family N-acetyltransferase [Bacillus sp. AFS019443]PFW60921.1 GNAT family N-acetyltransferase [Bacillus sp. AFS075034]